MNERPKRFTWETPVVRQPKTDAPPSMNKGANAKPKPNKPSNDLPRHTNGQIDLPEIRQNLKTELNDNRARRKLR